jgi:two-component system, NarL family, sensor histidine kinase LiaS
VREKINDFRLNQVKIHFFTSLYSGVIIFVLFQISLLIFDNLDPIVLSIVVPILFLVISFIIGTFLSYKEGRTTKNRLEDLSYFITILRRGNLSQRISDRGNDEIGKIGNELNQLADKVEQQVSSLQKVVNEKVDLAEKAHSAAIIEERQRLARDLHDAVSQQLFALNMMASACVRLIDSNVDAARKQMRDIAEIATTAQGEMRALLLHLRPVQLSGDSLKVGVKKLLAELEQKSNVTFDADINEIELPSKGIEDHLFRIVQEGLANVLRHAEATIVKIVLEQKERHIFLHIRDNGKGFDITKEKIASYGLKTMKERCEEVGGSLTITSKLEQGTALDVRIPVR